VLRAAPARRVCLLDAALDAALAAGLGACSAALGFAVGNQDKIRTQFDSPAQWQQGVLVWWLFAGLILLGLVIQHRWPLVAVVLAVAGATGHQLDPRVSVPLIDFAVPIVLYTLASLARTRWVPLSVLAVIAAVHYAIAAILLAAYTAPPGKPVLAQTWTEILATTASKSAQMLLLLLVAFALGDAARTRQAHLRTVEQRAADLERDQQQRAALATAAERARISRELHDVVAHGLSVMVVQAQGAAATLNRHPDRTETALRDVIATGRSSLAEMRRLIGVARRDPTADSQLAPQPGVGTLPALVEQVRTAGTPVRLRFAGERVALPAGVDLYAYRIVQEALTNTLKHAGPGAAATVLLTFHPDRLEMDISDDGVGPSTSDGTGNGLTGIAERIALLGGAVSVHRGAGEGFQIRAVLPITAPPITAQPIAAPPIAAPA
jgi:signal transduction histidine kinase